MKKSNQKKKDTSKGVKLPLIQSNNQKPNINENKENSSKGKMFSKPPENNKLKEVPQMPNIPTANNNSNNKKSLDSTNTSKTSKNKGKSEIINNKVNNEKPRISEEKLSQLKEQRKQRLKQEKKEEEKQMKLYEKLIEDYKNNTKERKTKKKTNENIEENPKIIISSQKAQTILEEGGMLDAYKYVLSQLCKIGLPTGNVFDYASIAVKNYEKKWKEKKSQMMKEKIDKYYEEKQKELESQSPETKKDSKIVNRSLEHREELKFIQSLDKSRSGRNVVPKINNSLPKSDRFSYIDRNYMLNSLKNENKAKIENKETENSISPNKLKEINVENKNDKNNNTNSNEVKSTSSKNNNNFNKKITKEKKSK